jgi:hypothetical protein
MNDDRRIPALLECAEILDEVTKTLNTEGSLCNTCGTFRRHDWEEYTLFDSLHTMSRKLRNAASRLEER